MDSWLDPEGGGTGGPDPLTKKSQKYRNHKATEQANYFGPLITARRRNALNGVSLAGR